MRQWFILSFLLVLLICFGVIMEWGLVAEVGTKLFGILPVLTPVLIGVGIIYIAWQQWQTNKAVAHRQLKIDENKLNLDLFDRRFKVYSALMEHVLCVIEIHHNVKLNGDDCDSFESKENLLPQKTKAFRRLGIDTASHVFLFGDDIAGLMKDVFNKGGEFSRSEFAEENYEWFCDMAKTLPGLFTRYMDFSKL